MESQDFINDIGSQSIGSETADEDILPDAPPTN